MYRRIQYNELKARREESRDKIQVLSGPRQVGKSTLVKQVLQEIDVPYMFMSVDNEGLSEFKKRFNPDYSFVVGSGGVLLEEFLLWDLGKLIDE